MRALVASLLLLLVPAHAFTAGAAGALQFRRAGVAHAQQQQPVFMKLVRQVNTAEFEEAIQDCSTPIVVDIYAVWCGPCQLMAPQLEMAATHFGDRVRFLKIDSDEEPEVANILKVTGLPTILFINDMSVVARAEGMLMNKELTELAEHHFFGAPAPQAQP